MTEAAATRITPFGDSALLVTLGNEIEVETNESVHNLVRVLRRRAAGDPRFGQPIPAYASVLVPFDLRLTSPDEVLEVVAGLVESPTIDHVEPAPPPRRHELPTRYGGVDGPDLEEVAALHDLTPADVVDIHASVEYRVYYLGFAPGFAYLGQVPPAIATPRRSTPRAHVAAGSVAIGRDQTGVYPFDTPAGWNVIGRTGVTLWNPDTDTPALLAPGDTVRFVPSR